MVVLKQLIFNSFHFGGLGGLERTDIQQLLHWDDVVVLKQLIFHSSYFERVWWS